MKLENILASRVIRFFEISAIGGGKLYGRKLSRRLEERYGFLEGPQKVEEFNLDSGVVFRHGEFDNRFVVDRMQIYSNGLLVESGASTEDIDLFVDDLIGWAEETADVSLQETPGQPKFYESSIEVSGVESIERTANLLQHVGTLLNAQVSKYGHADSQYEFSGMMWNLDLGGSSRIRLPQFRLERRENQPFSKGVYFSHAPLASKDHIALLKAIDDGVNNLTSS